MNDQPNVWRMRLNPSGGGNKGVKTNQFGFCYQRNIIGIGWQVVDEGDPSPTDPNKYLQLVENEYGSDGRGPLLEAKNISNANGTGMQCGDLVWVKNKDDEDALYLGKIVGEWKYHNDEKYRHADIVSTRPCRLFQVRSADVDGNSAKLFAEVLKFPPRTVQEVVTDVGVKQESFKIWEKIQKQVA